MSVRRRRRAWIDLGKVSKESQASSCLAEFLSFQQFQLHSIPARHAFSRERTGHQVAVRCALPSRETHALAEQKQKDGERARMRHVSQRNALTPIIVAVATSSTLSTRNTARRARPRGESDSVSPKPPSRTARDCEMSYRASHPTPQERPRLRAVKPEPRRAVATRRERPARADKQR